jgi:hypothetical protein
MERSAIGYKRIIILTIIATAAAITADYFGIIDKIAKLV